MRESAAQTVELGGEPDLLRVAVDEDLRQFIAQSLQSLFLGVEIGLDEMVGGCGVMIRMPRLRLIGVSSSTTRSWISMASVASRRSERSLEFWCRLSNSSN